MYNSPKLLVFYVEIKNLSNIWFHEFVVLVLESVFNKKQEEATQIMLHVHKNGIGVCGTFTYEVAESKCKSVMDLAKKHEHPLQCTMEKN